MPPPPPPPPVYAPQPSSFQQSGASIAQYEQPLQPPPVSFPPQQQFGGFQPQPQVGAQGGSGRMVCCCFPAQ
jgi:hypothetical protein